jgi:hypothetical protein
MRAVFYFLLINKIIVHMEGYFTSMRFSRAWYKVKNNEEVFGIRTQRMCFTTNYEYEAKVGRGVERVMFQARKGHSISMFD